MHVIISAGYRMMQNCRILKIAALSLNICIRKHYGPIFEFGQVTWVLFKDNSNDCWQTVQTQIRLLLLEQSDLSLHCLHCSMDRMSGVNSVHCHWGELAYINH